MDWPKVDFITEAYQEYFKGEHDKALDIIYWNMNLLMSQGKWEEVDKAIMHLCMDEKISFKVLPSLLEIGLLICLTWGEAPVKVKHAKEYYQLAEKRYGKPDNSRHLLWGLDKFNV